MILIELFCSERKMADNLLVANRDTPDVRSALITHQWRHSICGCFDNCGICILSYCCPCISFGQTAEVRGKVVWLYNATLSVYSDYHTDIICNSALVMLYFSQFSRSYDH